MLDITYLPNFIPNSDYVFRRLKDTVSWKDDMKSRKTASYGTPYNSSNVKYTHDKIPGYMEEWFESVKNVVGFTPNNVLLNYYFDSQSKMGFHSDDLSILKPNTGVVILSFGSSRIMRFKEKISGNTFDQLVQPGSLMFLSERNQLRFLHSILPSNNINDQRISVTLREIV